jgi:hypothetical protein
LGGKKEEEWKREGGKKEAVGKRGGREREAGGERAIVGRDLQKME